MKNNLSLTIAYRFTQLVSLILIVGGLAFLTIMVISLVDTNFLSNLNLHKPFSASFGIGSFSLCSVGDCGEKNAYRLIDLRKGMKLWLLLRGSIFFILTFLVLREILKVITSIRSKATFYIENVSAFNRMAILGIGLSLFSTFNFYIQGSDSLINFSIPFGPLGFMFACKVLADIFREGSHLTEENRSII